MAQTEIGWIVAFIALGTTSRADEKGQNNSALPCCIVTRLALGSLASVALSSNQVTGVYQAVNLSQRGHLYFAELGDISTLH